MASPIDYYIDRTKKPQWQDRRLIALTEEAKKKAKDAVAAAPDLYGGPRVQDAIADAKTQVKDAQAAAVPPDTYGAVLRELARSRTQMMIRSTNGRAGSLLGIGTDGPVQSLASPGRTDDRLTVANSGSGYPMQPIKPLNPNWQVARFARLTRPQ